MKKLEIKKSAMSYIIVVWLIAVGIVIYFMLSSPPASGFTGGKGVEVGVMRTKVISTGEICFVVERLQQTGISVSAEARQYPNEWREIFKDIGKVVPIVFSKVIFQMDGIFYCIPVQESEKALFYDGVTNTIAVKKNKSRVKGERKSVLVIYLCTLLVLFVSVCVFLETVEKGKITVAFFSVLFLLGFFVWFTLFVPFFLFPFPFLIFIVLFAFVFLRV